jgi:hypothetical protein
LLLMATLDQARAAKDEAHAVFSKLGSVVGVGITRDAAGTGYAVKVNLSADPGCNQALPERVQGVPVRVEVVGTITKR